MSALMVLLLQVYTTIAGAEVVANIVSVLFKVPSTSLVPPPLKP
jgi:hypothetical protein